MSISVDQARQVAFLARLELGDDHVEELASQLSAILDYVDQLQQVSTDGVLPLAHPLDVRNHFRDDELAPSLPSDEALAAAPESAGDPTSGGGHFLVPPVFD